MKSLLGRNQASAVAPFPFYGVNRWDAAKRLVALLPWLVKRSGLVNTAKMILHVYRREWVSSVCYGGNLMFITKHNGEHELHVFSKLASPSFFAFMFDRLSVLVDGPTVLIQHRPGREKALTRALRKPVYELYEGDGRSVYAVKLD